MTMWNEDLKGLLWRLSRGRLGVLYRPVVYVPGSLGPVKNSKISGDGIIRCHLFHWFPILWYLAHHFRVVQEIIIITYSPIKYSTPSLVSHNGCDPPLNLDLHTLYIFAPSSLHLILSWLTLHWRSLHEILLSTLCVLWCTMTTC